MIPWPSSSSLVKRIGFFSNYRGGDDDKEDGRGGGRSGRGELKVEVEEREWVGGTWQEMKEKDGNQN